MTDCRCGETTRDDAYFGENCADALTIALGDVPWLDEQLDITLTRQRAIPTEGGSRSSEKPLPWHDAAATARRDLYAMLRDWVRFCHDADVRNSSPSEALPRNTLPGMARWLLWRVDGLALHDIGPDAVDEITAAVNAATRIIDRRPDRWYAGPCNLDDCGGELYAVAKQGDVKCPKCEAVYDVDKRRAWLLGAAEDRLASAADVARAVSWFGAEPLTAARVRKWAERGRIAVKGHDGRHPLYRIGDAIDLLAKEANAS